MLYQAPRRTSLYQLFTQPHPHPHPHPRRRRRSPPSATPYTDLFSTIQTLNQAKSLHAHLLKTHPTPSTYLLNNLLTLYCTFAHAPLAHRLFDQMPHRDVVSYNSLASGYTQLGFHPTSISLLLDARNAGVVLDTYSYACALSVCARTGDLTNGRLVHGLIVVSGLLDNVFLTNSLIDMYGKCGVIDDARRVFESADRRDSVSWNSLISAYDRIRFAGEAMEVFVGMRRVGVTVNRFALCSVLNSCSGVVGEGGVGEMVHCCVVKFGFEGNVFVASALIGMYAKNRALEEAVKVFRRVPNPNVAVFNAMIAGLGRLENDELAFRALDLFSGMQKRGMRPSGSTFASVLRACNLSRAFECGKQIHGLVLKNDLQTDEFIGSSLIELYSNAGYIEDGLRCFSSLPKRDVVTWTSMISGYVENEQFERALALFKELLANGRVPGLYTMSTVMSACANLAALRSGMQIHSYAMKCGCASYTAYGNSQISMYSKSGDIEGAERTFREMEYHDVVSFSTMISSHAYHGGAKDAFDLFKKMEDRITPNHVTFLNVLTACSHGGMVDEGLFRYFESMKRDYGIKPNEMHCACIVDLLGRAGRLDDAQDFILESGYGDDPVMWRALLGSCRVHKDMDRATRIAERLLKLVPDDAASYVVMYNMYWDAGKLSLAKKTRDLMTDRRVKKEPGLSWIEIGKSVHSFVAGDNSHPKSSKIYAKLEQMLAKISHTTAETRASDEANLEAKHALLNCHSERLAVALGMIDLPESAPIRVIKNVRICADCHTIMKLLSECERREIIIRDPIRFHRFRGGSCSCGDFW